MSTWIQDHLGIAPDLQAKLLESLITILAIWILRWVVLMVVRKRTQEPQTLYRWRKSLTYVAVVLGILLVGRVWIKGLQTVGTFLGLLSAGLAIALKDLIANLAAWGFIIWRRPFEVGDRIQIAEHTGDVIDQRIFQFSLLEIGKWVDADQTTGRIIHVPNGKVLTTSLINYTRGFPYIWNEVGVLVTFESKWRKAKKLLSAISMRHAIPVKEAEEKIRAANRAFLIQFSKLTPIVYTAVKDNGVMLTIRYLCDPRRRRQTAEAIWEDVLDAFAANSDIDFAYPTTRFYDNIEEGKEGTRPAGDDDEEE